MSFILLSFALLAAQTAAAGVQVFEISGLEAPSSEETTPPGRQGKTTRADTQSILLRARDYYKRGNYEEALELLKGLHRRHPENFGVNYYLGLTYKAMKRLATAITYVKKAIAIDPGHGDAHSVLGEMYYDAGNYPDALTELHMARRYDGRPAYTSYLEGLVYLNSKQYDAAIKSLRTARTLDSSFSQKANYSMGIAYYHKGDFKRAESYLKTSVASGPSSAAGVYAKLSLEKMHRDRSGRRAAGRYGLRASARYALSYDDNVVLNPSQSILPSHISNQHDFRHAITLNAGYKTSLNKAWNLDSAYQFHSSFHHQLKQFNVIGHTLAITPSHPLRNGEFGVQAIGDLYYLNNRRYVGMLGGYIYYKRDFDKRNSGMFRCGARNSKYFQVPVIADENRDSDAVLCDYSHVFLYGREGGYARLDLNYLADNTSGNNWDSDQFSMGGTFSFPINTKLNGEFYGSYTLQDFTNRHSLFGVKRLDELYNMSAAMTLKTSRHWLLIGQYTWMKSRSNIGVYTYDRNILTSGFEYSY
jgi:tetratricopeptide (TPR) repeat protein